MIASQVDVLVKLYRDIEEATAVSSWGYLEKMCSLSGYYTSKQIFSTFPDIANIFFKKTFLGMER